LPALDPVSRCSFSSDGLTHSTSIPAGSDQGPDTPVRIELSPGAVREVVVDPADSFLYPPTSRRLDFSNQYPALAVQVAEESARRESLTSLQQKAPSSLSSESVSRRVERLLSEFESAPDSVVHDPVPFCPSLSGGEVPAISPMEAVVQMTREGVEPFPPPIESRPLPRLHYNSPSWHEDHSIGLKTLREIRELLGETAVSVASQQGTLSPEIPAERLASSEDQPVTLVTVGGSEFLSQWAATIPQTINLLGGGPETGLSQVPEPPASSITELLPDRGEAEEPSKRPAVTAGRERWTQPPSTSQAGRAEPEGCSRVTAGTVPSEESSRNSLSPDTLTGCGQAAPSAVPQLPSQHKDSRTGRGQEENNTTDSLAARIANLLQHQGDTTRDSNFTRAANEEKDQAQDREQKKLLVQPPDPLSILDEEDRRKIEEIKAELRQASKNPIHSEDGCSVNGEDFSLLSDHTSSVDTGPEVELPTVPSAEFRSVNVAQSQISSQLRKLSDNQFDTTVQLRTPLRRDMEEQLKAMSLDCPVGDCVESPQSQPTKPIIAITFSSRRKTPPPNSQLSSPLPKLRVTGKQAATEPSDEDSPSLARPSRDPVSLSLRSGPKLGELCQQSDSEQRKPHLGESSVVEQSPVESGEVSSPGTLAVRKPVCTFLDPCSSSPVRTVLSHVRVTLSPKLPASSGPLPSDVPAPSQNLHPCPEDPPATGDKPLSALSPANCDASNRSCPTAWQPDAHGPPYPPLPMPVPPFYPTFLPLFDCTSESRPELRIQTAQDSNKVDVSTQTIVPSPSEVPVNAAPSSKIGEQDVLAQVQSLQPELGSPMTVSTTSHTLVPPGT
ncbi:proteoglycan 4-like, partial [Chiloscyllium plagiosum]|uniref:proteoglycan 4-like n=1 Tax=Chiloscyllium plagiosum TaxID=36176 RepID=UPI001CB866ED